jgi:cholesterol transport system auxiliary component
VRMRRVAVVGAALIISGCSIGRPIPTVTTYSIEPPPAPADTPKPARPERLRVERVRVAAPYDRTSLVYRLSAVRYMSDPYHALLDDPGPMVGNRIAQWLAAAALFKTVDGPGGAAAPPWVLETTVTDLYGDFEAGDGNPAAVMSIRFTVIDESGGRPRVAYQRSLSRRAPLSRGSPEALVQGYGTALGAILTEFATDFSNSTSQ